MIAFTVRFIGLWLIAAALVAGVIDVTKSIAANGVVMTPLGATWFSINRQSLEAAQRGVETNVETYVGGWLWDPVIQSILGLPTWAVVGVLGALMVYLGRRRRRRAMM